MTFDYIINSVKNSKNRIGWMILLSISVVLLLSNLGHPVGLSELEAQSVESSRTLTLDSIIYIPYYAALNLFAKIFGESIFVYRLVSVVFALSAISLWYGACRKLFDPRVALLGAIILASSSWFLYIARSVDPTVFAILLQAYLLYTAAYVMKKPNDWIGYVLSGVGVGLAAYAPFAAYIVAPLALVGVITFYKKHLVLSINGLMLGILAALITMLPFFVSIYFNPQQVPALLGFNSDILISNFANNVGAALLSLGFYWHPEPTTHLTALPALTNVELVLFVGGLLQLIVGRHSVRAKIIIVATVALFILIGVFGHKTGLFYALIPSIFIVITMGVSLLFSSWKQVFPKNKQSHTFVMLVLLLLISINGVQHYRRYFVGWQNVPETALSHEIQL